MSVESLGNGIHLLRLSLPFATPPAVNCYFIEGPAGLTLIDAGVDDDEAKTALAAAVTAIAGTPEALRYVIGTHLHVDHVGGLRRVRETTGAEVILHSSTPRFLDEYNDWSIGRDMVVRIAGENGAPADELEQMRMTWPRPDWAPHLAEPDRTVDDLERIDIGDGRHLEVLHTPGHHPTHICLRDSLTGRVFSGDHVLGRITPFVPYSEDRDRLGLYLDSLERIEDLDVEMTYPAHGALVDHGSTRAHQIGLHHARRIGAMLEQTRQEPKTAWEIMRAVFRPDMDVMQTFLAFQETMAHLDHMVRIGRINRTIDHGTWRFRP